MINMIEPGFSPVNHLNPVQCSSVGLPVPARIFTPIEMKSHSRLLAAALVAAASCLAAQQPIDSAYTAKIDQLTPTDPKWKFTTELVDYLPASATVPSPLKVLGYVPGTIGRLSHVADINRYFNASPPLAAGEVVSMGMSDEGREMIVVAIADSATIARLDDYRAMARSSPTRAD